MINPQIPPTIERDKWMSIIKIVPFQSNNSYYTINFSFLALSTCSNL